MLLTVNDNMFQLDDVIIPIDLYHLFKRTDWSKRVYFRLQSKGYENLFLFMDTISDSANFYVMPIIYINRFAGK